MFEYAQPKVTITLSLLIDVGKKKGNSKVAATMLLNSGNWKIVFRTIEAKAAAETDIAQQKEVFGEKVYIIKPIITVVAYAIFTKNLQSTNKATIL